MEEIFDTRPICLKCGGRIIPDRYFWKCKKCHTIMNLGDMDSVCPVCFSPILVSPAGYGEPIGFPIFCSNPQCPSIEITLRQDGRYMDESYITMTWQGFTILNDLPYQYTFFRYDPDKPTGLSPVKEHSLRILKKYIDQYLDYHSKK